MSGPETEHDSLLTKEGFIFCVGFSYAVSRHPKSLHTLPGPLRRVSYQGGSYSCSLKFEYPKVSPDGPQTYGRDGKRSITETCGRNGIDGVHLISILVSELEYPNNPFNVLPDVYFTTFVLEPVPLLHHLLRIIY